MFRQSLVWMGVLALVLTGALYADHHHFVEAMKGVGANMGPTGKALEAGDMATVQKNADAITQHYKVMGAWWEGRGTGSAVGIADKGVDAAMALSKAAASGDKAAAEAAFGQLRGTCKECHTAHRVKNDDGSYGFKD